MFGLGKKKKEPVTVTQPPKRTSHLETFKVAGIPYHMDALKELMEENDDYTMTKKEIIEADMEDEYIYQYVFPYEPVELIKEPDNPEDKNAIKIILAGEHIGYIQKSKCKYIASLMDSNRIGKMSVDITGGKYKILRDDELDKDEYEYRATLDISVRDLKE